MNNYYKNGMEKNMASMTSHPDQIDTAQPHQPEATLPTAETETT